MLDLRPAWAEINLAAIAANVEAIRNLVGPKVRVMAVVKANAYGHGAVRVAQTALQHGASYVGVAILQEALQLRQAGVTAPILILGYTPPEQAPYLVKNDISQTVYDLATAQVLDETAARLGRKARVHIKVDTGMGRIGFQTDDAGIKAVFQVARLPHLELEGIYTHFATADSADKTYALWQFDRFQEVLAKLRAGGLEFPLRHAANSGAVVDLPQTHLDMVRPGILVYGLYPSTEVRQERLQLQPAMALKAKVSHIKDVPAGFGISYGRTYLTPQPTTIATIPLGYADGFSRLLSGKAEVLIGGRRAPVVGRICMDQCMADVGHIPGVKVGDEVVLFGRQDGDEISVEEVAAWMGTINYEILCLLSERVPRVYI